MKFFFNFIIRRRDVFLEAEHVWERCGGEATAGAWKGCCFCRCIRCWEVGDVISAVSESIQVVVGFDLGNGQCSSRLVNSARYQVDRAVTSGVQDVVVLNDEVLVGPVLWKCETTMRASGYNSTQILWSKVEGFQKCCGELVVDNLIQNENFGRRKKKVD